MKNTNYFSLKKILVFVVFMLSLNCFAQTQQEKVKVGVLHGPSCIPTIKLIEDSSDKYSFEKYADPQALLPKLLKNEIASAVSTGSTTASAPPGPPTTVCAC